MMYPLNHVASTLNPKSSLQKILAIDIGAGTQDVLLYNSELTPENCISLILPTPSRNFARLIERCEGDIFIEGDPIGGGAIPSLLKSHIKKGSRVIMSEDAAYTLRNNINEVREYGIQINSSGLNDFNGTKICLHEIDFALLKEFLANYGEDLDIDLVAIAVQDHGTQPEGTSNREFRFKMIEERLRKDNRPESFVYTYDEIPACFKRMKAVARTAKMQSRSEVLVMDTSFAAILGCLQESQTSLFVNVGNSHTLAAMISKGKIEGVMEHHTSCLNTEKLDDLIVRFMKSEITSQEILNDGGHGAVILNTKIDDKKEIIVTGPNRGILKNSRLNVRFAAPHGNMMLTGPYGLVKGAQLKYSSSQT